MNGVNEGQLTIWPEYELTVGVPVDAANDVSTGPERYDIGHPTTKLSNNQEYHIG